MLSVPLYHPFSSLDHDVVVVSHLLCLSFAVSLIHCVSHSLCLSFTVSLSVSLPDHSALPLAPPHHPTTNRSCRTAYHCSCSRRVYVSKLLLLTTVYYCILLHNFCTLHVIQLCVRSLHSTMSGRRLRETVYKVCSTVYIDKGVRLSLPSFICVH